jgi:recombinational DNA repair protein (RecF pathway)
MRDQRSNAGAPGNGAQYKRCSRCRKAKPITAFYRNPNSICKDCQNRASRFSNEVRRAAIAHLIAAYQTEYHAHLQTERTTRTGVESGGGSDAA